ncbi:MAG: hypothetical protein KKB20_26520, partial [Proteobacteria bacterium]|nr:hypothetical protein [Pseudomonadota bacterium]
MTRDTGSILISESIEERFGVELENAAPERPRIVLRPGGRVDGDPASIEIAFFSNDSYPDRVIEFVRVVSESRALRWLHTFSAGVDNPWFRAMLDQGVRVTTSSGAAASAIAQSVMMFILALSRDLPAWFRAQSDRVWSRHEVQELPDQVLGVAGLGPIGLETARLGSAFGMRVIGLRRRVLGDEPCETWTFDRLDEMLALADFLVLALPLAPETRGLLNARTI